MDSFLKLKSEFDNLVSKIKIPGSEVSFLVSLMSSIFSFRFSPRRRWSHNTKKIVNGVDTRTKRFSILLESLLSSEMDLKIEN